MLNHSYLATPGPLGAMLYTFTRGLKTWGNGALGLAKNNNMHDIRVSDLIARSMVFVIFDGIIFCNKSCFEKNDFFY